MKLIVTVIYLSSVLSYENTFKGGYCRWPIAEMVPDLKVDHTDIIP